MPFLRAITVTRPTTTDTTNPDGILYIIGSANVDGSIRLIFTEGDDDAHIETRASGVWNDTDFRFSAESVEIGRDLKIEASADFIKTKNPSGFGIHSEALIPHIPFTGTGTLFPHTPVADVLADNIIFSIAVSEISGTTLSQTFPITSAQIISTITYEIGTIGATDDVQHTIYQGVDNTGSIIHRINLPASDLIADTSLIIDFGSAFGFSEQQDNIFVEFVTATSFALKTDVSGNILITLNSQQLETRDLLYDDLVFNTSLGLILDSSLNPIYVNQF